MPTNSNKLSPQRETYVDKIVELVEEQILSGTYRPSQKSVKVNWQKNSV